jgi:hypothetical protein
MGGKELGDHNLDQNLAYFENWAIFFQTRVRQIG